MTPTLQSNGQAGDANVRWRALTFDSILCSDRRGGWPRRMPHAGRHSTVAGPMTAVGQERWPSG